MTLSPLLVDMDVIKRYDTVGPRYTSYPTAVQFSNNFREIDYRCTAQLSNEDLIPAPLSLHIHTPFCSTLCYHCACNKVLTKEPSKVGDYLRRLHTEVQLQGDLFHRDRLVLQLHFGGGTPAFLTFDQIDRLMCVIKAHFELSTRDDRDYCIEVDPRRVDPTALFALRALGFNRICIGIQDIESEVQWAAYGAQSQELTLAIIGAAQDAEFHSISVNLMYGLPFQTVRSFRRTLDKIVAADPDRISLFNYAHLPERFPPQKRIRGGGELPAPDLTFEILSDTIERLTAEGYEYIGRDSFAKYNDDLAVAHRDGGLCRNSQGYSTHAHCDLVGIGVSSMGRVGDCLSQNVGNLNQYYRRIDAKRLAISRGIKPTHDDRLRAEIINRLMCYSEIDTKAIERRYGILFPRYFENELRELETMEQDGLLTTHETNIRLTPVGRFLVRNVCMSFDRYLREREHEQRFSRVI